MLIATTEKVVSVVARHAGRCGTAAIPADLQAKMPEGTDLSSGSYSYQHAKLLIDRSYKPVGADWTTRDFQYHTQ